MNRVMNLWVRKVLGHYRLDAQPTIGDHRLVLISITLLVGLVDWLVV
jgi:hypothetical protein